MKSRWIANLVLLLLVAGIGLFLYLRPKPVNQAASVYPVSTFEAGKVSRIEVETPGKKPVQFEKTDNRWRMVQPMQGRADIITIGRILNILNATSKEKLPSNDLTRFGLDSPSVKLKLDDQEFNFGMYHPVSGDQFVAYKDAVYLLPTIYSELATTQPVEMLDKHLLRSDENVVGFDFSHLEQWESSHLNLDMQDSGQWKVSVAAAKPVQNEINEWFDAYWRRLEAKSVEPFKPDSHQPPQPYLTLRLRGGKTIKLVKMQESPELLLVREDEGMQYHIPQDIGFVVLNPPVGFKPE